MKQLILILLIFLLTLGMHLRAQDCAPVAVDSLEARYQRCLDGGQDMPGCARMFYLQMDSMLNVYYQKIKISCNKEQRENLKDEEMEWLDRRYDYFKKTLAESRHNVGKRDPVPLDNLMVKYNDDAAFVKARAVQLSLRKNNDYAPDHYVVNDEGYYTLDNRKKSLNGDVRGFAGDMVVMKYKDNKVIIRLSIEGAANDQGAGYIYDTLTVKNNLAIYRAPELSDTSCRVYFSFYKQGVQVREVSADYNLNCGLGHGARVDGFYKRKYERVVTEKDMKK